MDKMNRITVLVDFSEHSKNLVNFAFGLSESIKAKVLFIHKYTSMVPGMTDQDTRDEIMRTNKEEAHAKLWKLVKNRVFSEDSIHVSPKPILTILNELKADRYFDWVLAGLKGTGALKRLFIGSTTVSIIDNSDHLTIAVPINMPISIPRKLLVGVNPLFPLNQHQFSNMLRTLAGKVQEVEFFSIVKDGENEDKAKDQLNRLRKEYDAYNSSISLFKGEDAFNGLKAYLEKTPDSFLVLQQGSRSLQDKLFRKFMINELVYSGQTPLIVISK
ncbi:universal stress protein [Gillisia hiemivivida]|uniref:Universal stress protein n=2 Tax=Gillisia hiemivivida TaxID=291190 RepID=A0A5C6ZNJ1_9FLAO|nr:universal stress protein [Gillisia hiemivivida]